MAPPAGPQPWPMSPVQKRFSFATVRRKSKFALPALDSAAPDDGEAPLATLRVQVVACRNLHSADANGKSDPYVGVSFQRLKQKTPVIQKTLDPHWPAKEATFDFPLYKSVAERLGTLLEIVVWDKDFIGKDYLGEVSLPASRWFERNAGGMNFERAEVRSVAPTAIPAVCKKIVACCAGRLPRVADGAPPREETSYPTLGESAETPFRVQQCCLTTAQLA